VSHLSRIAGQSSMAYDVLATDDHQNGDLGVLLYKYIYKFSKMCVLCVCILIRPPLKNRLELSSNA